MPGRRFLLLLVGVSLLPCSAGPAAADWPHSPTINVPLCTATGSQSSPKSVPDGSGGAVVVWLDSRSGTTGIYAQHVSTSGVVQWASDGVMLCAATGSGSDLSVVSDGAGGAILTWQDKRAGNWDVYAQRVNAAGVAQWATNGVALCAAAGDQVVPAIVSDGAGGAIVTWEDGRHAYTDIYAQRVNAAGVVQWTANGIAVCAAAADQGSPGIAADGAGGAIVTWSDIRYWTTYDIYAQRLSAAGVAQWDPDGVVVCEAVADQAHPTVASDGSGGAIVAWEDQRNGNWNVYAQRLDATGVVQWTADGVWLCYASGGQFGPIAIADGSGGAIVAWQDQRAGNMDLYAQRVNAGGVSLWTVNGVGVCTMGTNQTGLTLATDGLGGAILAWQDPRSGTCDIYAQRVSAAGSAMWSANGVAICTATGAQTAPTLVMDGLDGAIVAWQDQRSGGDDIYAQWVALTGYLAHLEPAITSVRDLPDDQGGHVRIRWNACYGDTLPTLPIGLYGIWRRVTGEVARAAMAGGAVLAGGDGAGARVGPGVFRVERADSVTTWWEGVGTVAARGLAWYTFVAETFQDSTAAGNPYTTFMVDAHGAFTPLLYDSRPDSGYSVDNLAPATPAAFTGQYAAGTATLSWAANGEGDLSGYRLYRGTTAGFAPGPGNLVAAGSATGYVDAAGSPRWYKVSAVDVHGNESGYATLLPTGTVGVEEGGGVALSLALAGANPCRGGATLRWGLPAAGEARLTVYDVAGRAVRVLVAGRESAGEHRAAWDGRDESGAPAGPGLYFARLEACGRTLRARLVLVR